MGNNTKIEWTSYTRPDGTVVPGATLNPWRGCTKVSAGCTHCYAETMSKRNPAVLGVWGRHGARAAAAESYWRQPLAWNKAAAQAGERRRVFCASLADVFEGEDTMPAESWPLVQAARGRLWETIEATPHLDWLLLTKRPENATALATRWTGGAWPANVWLGTSVENQKAADERIPHLLNVPARVRFLSMEPLLGMVALDRWIGPDAPEPIGLHWIIVGGESGAQARPIHPHWARSLRDQAQRAGVNFFFKQWGEYWPAGKRIVEGREMVLMGDEAMYRVGKHAAGRLLDGREWNEAPA